jgi:septal ring factor EnvC (AmiA/AmiB activator)
VGTADAQTNRTLAQAERERRTESARAARLRRDAATAAQQAEALGGQLEAAQQRLVASERAALDAEHLFAATQARIYAERTRRGSARAALESALIAAAFADRRGGRNATRAGVFAGAAAVEWLQAERAAASGEALALMAEVRAGDEQLALAQAQAALGGERERLRASLEAERTRRAELVNAATTADRRVNALAAEARALRQLAERVERARRRADSGGGTSRGASVIPASWLSPVEGRVARSFGEAQGGRPALQGVVLRTGGGASVAAPAAGDVAYAGVFRSYGEVLILNVEGGYALVLTGLDAINVQVGDTVRAGQPVGTMPASAIPAPELYVEVRRGGRAVDPGAWLTASGNAGRNGGARAG